jgi:hypothetical protein
MGSSLWSATFRCFATPFIHQKAEHNRNIDASTPEQAGPATTIIETTYDLVTRHIPEQEFIYGPNSFNKGTKMENQKQGTFVR